MLMAADRLLTRIEDVTDTLAMSALFAAMIVVATEVFCRYALSAPQSWVYPVIVLYLMPILFFLGLPGSYRRSVHVAVDILGNFLSPRKRVILALLSRVVAIAIFALVGWYGWFRFLEGYRAGSMQPGILMNYPHWPSLLLVPLGCAVAFLRSIERTFAEARALFGGEENLDAVLSHHLDPEDAPV